MKTALIPFTGISKRVLLIRIMLICGILSSVLYIATVVLAALGWADYSSTSQTVSELIAINAPTRPIVAPLFVIYAFLIFAFGLGVWQSSIQKPARHFIMVGLVGKEVLGLVVTLFFPMHLRGVGATLTDTMHGVLTCVGVLFMLLAIGFGASAFGKSFRFYSFGTIVLLILGGSLAGSDAPRIAANLATPWAGVTERFNIFAYMLWVIVLAIILIRKEKLLYPIKGTKA